MSFLILAVCASAAEPVALPRLPIGTPIYDFALRSSHGSSHRLSDFRKSRAVVVVFLGTQCPLARLYAPRLATLAHKYKSAGVAFLAADPSREVSADDLQTFETEYRPGVPIWVDADHAVADRLGIERVPTAVVLDRERRIRYRGRIDDQYTFAAHLPKPNRRELEDALDAVLADKPVTVTENLPDGCPIERERETAPSKQASWNDSVAEIVQRKCYGCHRAGSAAPFALASAEDVRKHATGVVEALRDERMPPWSATGAHGVFANDARLTPTEKSQLLAWIAGGCVADEREKSFETVDDGWGIPTPDLVVQMPQEFSVPAEGVVDYQTFDAPLNLDREVWVQAAEIRAGNPAVVHHCNVYLKPPSGGMPRLVGDLGSFCLATTTQLKQSTVFPAGMAKRIPAGWQVSFMMHYTPIGKATTDRTSIGLKLVDPRSVRQEVGTCCLIDESLVIPPHAKNHRIERTWQAPADVVLLSLFPHMHLRGKSFLYEAIFPDGRAETLLEVPRFDYAWQHRYEFAAPRRFPKGTVIRCVGVYDNSEDNPANPDPNATVKAGQQVWDEMFNGYFDWALADQDLIAERHWTAGVRRFLAHPVVLACALAAALFAFLRIRGTSFQLVRSNAKE